MFRELLCPIPLPITGFLSLQHLTWLNVYRENTSLCRGALDPGYPLSVALCSLTLALMKFLLLGLKYRGQNKPTATDQGTGHNCKPITRKGVGGRQRGGTRRERGERRWKEEEQLCLIHPFSQVEISGTVEIRIGEISLKINDLLITLLGFYPKELKT